MKLKLFTTTRCSKCPAAKKFLDDNNMQYDYHVVDKDEEAYKLASELQIVQVPTIAIIGDDFKEIMTFNVFKSKYEDASLLEANKRVLDFFQKEIHIL